MRLSRCFELLGFVIAAVLLWSCSFGAARTIRVLDAEKNRPVSGKTLHLWEDIPDAEGSTAEFRINLDANGEARVRLKKTEWWALVDEAGGVGVTVRVRDLESGARLRLYSAAPTPGDTNTYRSKYVLEIRKR